MKRTYAKRVQTRAGVPQRSYQRNPGQVKEFNREQPYDPESSATIQALNKRLEEIRRQCAVPQTTEDNS
jgi:hypothetical protein